MRVKLLIESYQYESLDDMKAHKEYMLKQRGATVLEENEEYLYIDYQFDNEYITEEI